MSLKRKMWDTYRSLAARFPVIRKVLAPIRWYYHYNIFSYAIHRLLGISYREWYAKTLNSFANSIDIPDPGEGLEALEKQMGNHQLEYLKNQGLKPHHSLLDYGCGYLRAGIHFIDYLEPGNYTGIDISSGRLNQGKRILAKLRLEQKRPELVALPDMKLEKLTGKKFDFIWSHGVLSHMPAEDIELLIKSLPNILGENSVFLGNYTELAEGKVKMATLRHFFFNHSVFEKLCAKYGLRCEFMVEWENIHPHELSKIDRMVKISPRSADSTVEQEETVHTAR